MIIDGIESIYYTKDNFPHLFSYICVMIKTAKLIYVCLACWLSLTSFAYSGRVYVDKNASGSFDKNDTPLPGVVVTDGRNTVRTGKDGRFTLPGYERTNFITVTTPAGYRIDRPYLPVATSQQAYDFALTLCEATAHDDHAFIQITDTEIHNRGVAMDWVDYLKTYITTERPAFLIHTGDICYENGLRSHIQVVNNKTMGCPVYYCIGNHDLTKGDYGEQLFESLYGPTWYSFDVGNVHYVITPMTGGDHRPGYTQAEVYEWLKNDLAMKDPGKQLVIFNHDILTTNDDFIFGISDTERIDLRKYNLKAWIYGHWHINYVRNQNGVYTVCTATLDKGGIDHSPSAFRVFDMRKDSIAGMNLHYCFIDHQAVIATPVNGQTTPLLPSGAIPLSVNAYHSGCEIAKVTYTCKTGDSWSQPEPMQSKSDWNWYAEINPGSFRVVGEVEAKVIVTFNDGHETTAVSRFLYNPSYKPALKPAAPWTSLAGDAAHTGNTGHTVTPPLRLAWVQNVGTTIFIASPLITDGRVIVASTDDDNRRKQNLSAFDLQSGKLLWTFPTRNSVKNSISCNNQTVFAQDADSWLYAIDIATGRLKWEKQLNKNEYPYLEDGLVVANNVLYAGSGTGLSAYSATDGTCLWTNTDWKKSEGTTTTLTIGNGVLTAGAQWRALYGHDAQTGRLLWKLSEEGLSDRGASTTLHDNLFYVISQSSLFVIEPQTGEIIKQAKLQEFNLNVTSTPLITDTEIIFGSADKGLVALNKETLDIKWTLPVNQSLVYTSPYVTTPNGSVETTPILSDGVIYFGASDGFLYGVKTGTGETVFRMPTGAPFLASVAASGNILVAVDFAGNVYAFYGNNK